MFGGFLEYTAMAMGLKSLHLIAVGLHALSFPVTVLSGES